MKVLLLYQYLNHTSTVSSLADHLKPEGINVDCLDLPTLSFTSGKVGHSRFIRFLYNIKLIRHFFSKVLKTKYVLSQIQDYDIIDIHSYSLFYNEIIPTIKKSGKPLIIMIWGSDFYRASAEDLEAKRLGFTLADIVHLESEQVRCDFIKVYPEYKNKTYVVQFGLNQLDWLKQAMETPLSATTLIDNQLFNHKLIVTCGYNGSKGQQHLKMVEAINQQPDIIKSKIHVIIPFTYGGDNHYKNEISCALNQGHISYTILDKHLSDEQMVELRRISHITVNIQITDSFSASIQEHFMAGSVQIIGDWLPYDVFYNQGLYALKTSIERLKEAITEVINNYSQYLALCKNNQNIIYRFSAWSYIVPKWVALYNYVYQQEQQ